MDKYAISTFHAVGQGLFYSFALDEFNMVYDCGSNNAVPRNYAVKKYKAQINEKIDLLILSHLHQDHINGLTNLLKNLKVDTLILPYLSPLERVYLTVTQPRVSERYLQFLLNPLRVLSDITQINKIVLVGWQSEDGSEEYNDDFPAPKESDDNREREEDLSSSMEHDSDLETFITNNDPDLITGGMNVKFVKNYGNIKYQSIWRFEFLNLRLEGNIENELKKCLKKLNIRYRDQNQLLKEMMKGTSRRRLRKCYPANGTPMNNTSLMLFHGPINPKKVITFPWMVGPYPLLIIRPVRTGKKSWGHLLLGDVNLNTMHNSMTSLDKILSRFKIWLNEIVISLVPHHGALDYWSDDILSNLPHCNNWITSADLNGRWKHPSRNVVRSITQVSNFHFSNEYNQIDFGALIKF